LEIASKQTIVYYLIENKCCLIICFTYISMIIAGKPVRRRTYNGRE
jgi:hypothetical protein